MSTLTVPLLHDYPHQSVKRLSEKIALVCGRQRLSYCEVEARSNALAHVFMVRSVARGESGGGLRGQHVDTVGSFWAVLNANAVIPIVNPLTKTDKLDVLATDTLPGRPRTHGSGRAELLHPALRGQRLA